MSDRLRLFSCMFGSAPFLKWEGEEPWNDYFHLICYTLGAAVFLC